MSIQYGYYLPLSTELFDEVYFLGISPKTEGLGNAAQQKLDKDGTPVWLVTAIVKFQDGNPSTELFSMAAPQRVADEVSQIPMLSAIELVGLSGGKWSKATSDKTTWTFQITGFQTI